MSKYMDGDGLAYLWEKLKTLLAKNDLSNVTNEDFLSKANTAGWHSDKPISKSVTLSASGWDSSKTQTITVQGVLADEAKQLITSTPTIASQEAYYNAGIRCTGQAANSLTFTAKTIPTANLTVYVTIQEVEVGA